MAAAGSGSGGTDGWTGSEPPKEQVAEVTPWDLQWRQKIVGRTSQTLVCVAKSAPKVGEAHSVTRVDQNPGIVAIYLQLTKTPFQNDPATGQITY